MRILGISGSLSGASSNSALLRRLCELSPEDEVVLYESLDAIPHFSPDRDHEPVPPAVVALRTSVQRSDAVLIATPEYAGGMPGALKNALDWLVGSGELYGKAAVIVSAAPSEERGHHARAWVGQTLRMQGARICDSFSVAVPRNQQDEALATAAPAVLDRARRSLTEGRCASVLG